MVGIPTSRHARAVAALVLFGVLGAVLLGFSLRAATPRADFVFTGGGEPRSIDPHAVTGVPEGRVIRLLYEGLLARDPASGAPAPGVAESWTVSPDELVYTFRLRADARWSNGDPLTAADFEWSFQRLLAPETAAEYASSLWCVEGAREFTTGAHSDFTRVGIRALDEHSLEMRLARHTPYFLELLSYHVFAPVHRASLESLQTRFPSRWASEWTRPDNLVVNGPFVLTERRIADRMRFARNEMYWDAQHVAMRTVDVLAVESWNSALNLYLTGAVDWVDGAIPANLAPSLAGREDYRPEPYLGVYFYRINVTKPPLDDLRVRRALAYSLTRGALCDNVLKAGQKPGLTFVPGGRLGAYRSPPPLPETSGPVRGFLSEAGFGPEKKPFPTLEIHFNSGETHRDIAEVIADQWRRTLGIEVRLRNQEWKSFLDAQSKLDYDVSRSSWIADYRDVSSFLDIWVTGHENNRTGWSNATYDRVVREAQAEKNPQRRLELYKTAEWVLLSELPCIPIYHYVSQNLLDARVGGFGSNPLNDQAPKDWYWRDDAELAAARAANARRGREVPSHGPKAGLYARERATTEGAK